MSSKKQKNKEIGALGEQIAANFLKDKGFSIVEMNFWRKWGELDIIARKQEKCSKKSAIHFVEVKTVSYETKQLLEYAVSHETWRPEELVHHWKLHKMHLALESWIMEHNYDGDFNVDVIAVKVVQHEKYASIKYIENIIS